ncbi:PPC domain-containing protein [Pseudomonas yamanorum]|uniref:Pre-peptidase C-terminal domain-containing protein n=1 Tax=Pseudomonas yamanorum TaxID=515393 RepID=A0A7Y8FJ30_9PSED|nr:PPC domain-containing protein [Pseudomonas yamanorum]NWE80326.1 pre-peptidase C-terminal domain-containing protein [Pseudomonas yamanorum]
MKSKKAFVLGAAMMAASFVSAFALAEQYPSQSSVHLSEKSLSAAVKSALKSGGKVQATASSAQVLDKLKVAQTAKPVGVSRQVASVAKPSESVQIAAVSRLVKSAKAPAAQAAFVPLCDSLDINVGYSYDGLLSGQSQCFHFNVPAKAKVQIYLAGQQPGTEMALTLFQDDGQNNLTALITSDNPGNSDEVISGMLEAGDYYWFLEAKVADGSAFDFGAIVNTAIDAYEPNDTAETAFALPDRLNYLTGNLDSPDDVDYFDFAAVRGQGVSLFLGDDDKGVRNQWIFEYFNGSAWVNIPGGSTATFPSRAPGFVYKARVRANPAEVWDAKSEYKLTFGSSPRLTDSDARGGTVTRIPVGVAPLATQAGRLMTWRTEWKDSTGAPLVGVTSQLKVDKRFVPGPDFNWTVFSAVTDSAGKTSGSAELGGCVGDYRAQYYDSSTGVKYLWDTWYNVGGWRIDLKELPNVGVGGDNVPYVSLGHICSQDIIGR